MLRRIEYRIYKNDIETRRELEKLGFTNSLEVLDISKFKYLVVCEDLTYQPRMSYYSLTYNNSNKVILCF